MIWKAKYNTPAQEGDLRVINKFAWLPHHIKDKIVWLESYQELWEYRMAQRAPKWMEQPPFLDWDLVGEKLNRGLPHMDNPPPPPGSNKDEKEKWVEFCKEQKKKRYV